MITDTLHSASHQVWVISSAMAIVALTNNMFDLVVTCYDAIITRSGMHGEHLSTSWNILISINTVKILVSVIACVGGINMVLRDTWTEQLTSALVVGVGFGMQGAIQDTTWGYFRRSYGCIMQKGTTIELVPFAGSKPIQGKIENMHISSFVFVDDKQNRYVLPWTVLRAFKWVPSLEGVGNAITMHNLK